MEPQAIGRADFHRTLGRIGIAYHCPIPPRRSACPALLGPLPNAPSVIGQAMTLTGVASRGAVWPGWHLGTMNQLVRCWDYSLSCRQRVQ